MNMAKGYLKRLRLEIQELLGMLSVDELAFNKRLSKEYEALHRRMMAMN